MIGVGMWMGIVLQCYKGGILSGDEGIWAVAVIGEDLSEVDSGGYV